MTPPHIIHRQVLHITLPRQENAFEFQNRISELYQTQVVAVLDEVCGQLDSQEEYLQIEKLEIDLGNVSPMDLEGEFTVKVREHFSEALTARAHSVRRLRSDSPNVDALAARAEKIRGSPASSSFQKEDRMLSAKTFKLELIGHFMRTGRLPWWADRTDAGELEDMLSSLLLEDSEEIQPAVEEEIRKRGARHRLIYQFSDSMLFGMVAWLTPGEQAAVKGWVEDIGKVFQEVPIDRIPAPEMRLLIWDAVFTEGKISRQKAFDAKGAWQYVMAEVARQSHRSYRSILVWMHAAVERLRRSRESFQTSLLRFLASQLRDIQDAPLFSDKEAEERNEFSRPRQGRRPSLLAPPNFVTLPARSLSRENRKALAESDFQIAGFAPHQGKTDIPSPDTRRSSRRGDIETGRAVAGPLGLAEFEPRASATIREAYVENAGLVLLWPYLSNFYRRLDLLADNGFADEVAASRAIHLLQYLATGARETPEFLLPLNKLLCGWDMDKPISKKMDVSDPEEAEAEKLLGTVISHWKALKNTSISGLRRSFLQRNGILTERDANWQLQVERKTYDLLLEHLPWGISMIKLSWMGKMLQVEW